MALGTPDAWIGEDVMVQVGNPVESFWGPLLEVNDRGVTIHYLQKLGELEERRQLGEKVEDLRQEMRHHQVFFHWNNVRLIARPGKPEEE